MRRAHTREAGRLALVGLLALVAPEAARAQGLPSPSAIDAVFAEWDGVHSVGCALGVVRDGRFLYKRGYGMANLDWGIPITPSTVFYVGSISKQFTAASIALLAREGKLDLDADIHTYLPELIDYGHTVTVRHVIHHVSGVPDMYRVMARNGVSPANVFTREEGLELMARQPLDFPPGERYAYSNGGYFLLSMIVERASGQSLREYADENIFRPLGMLDTHFHDDPGHIVPGRAMSYERRPEGGYRQSYLNNFALPGAGGLYTTVEDLLSWDRSFYDDRLGGPDFMELLHTRGVLNDGETLPYAFALQHGEYRGLKTVGHTGSFMGFKAAYMRFPEQRFSVWTLCNLGAMNPGEFSRRVADLFLAEEFAEPATR